MFFWLAEKAFPKGSDHHWESIFTLPGLLWGVGGSTKTSRLLLISHATGPMARRILAIAVVTILMHTYTFSHTLVLSTEVINPRHVVICRSGLGSGSASVFLCSVFDTTVHLSAFKENTPCLVGVCRSGLEFESVGIETSSAKHLRFGQPARPKSAVWAAGLTGILQLG